MASIADLFVKVVAELTGFEAEVVKGAEKAGDKAGKALSARMGANLKTGAVKAFGLAASGAFAVATKGALELAEVQRQFQSETGASAEEAKAAADTINRVAGSQQQSLEAVSQAAIHVRRDLGLVGPEADAMTETIVKFARATKQDAGDAVSQLDDILDSWGLTAKDADGILNKLLVSQHKFGGEISETSKTLAALAPAMRAANLTVDDGVALLGLFGAKGLDAGQASAAFAKALTKVKSPKELQDLITDISNTEDPFLRAQKAADLFGAKAGAKLANALGGAHLEDYKISMEEAAGATDKAVEALDSGFGGQFRKKMSEAGAAVRAFGSDFGPAVTGAASLAALIGTLGGGKAAGALAGALKGVWLKVAASSVVSAAVGRAGSVAATAYLQALITGDRIAGAVKAAMGSSAVQGASSKLGSFLGSSAGKAFSVGFAAVAIVEMVKTEQEIIETTKAQLAQAQTDIDKQVATGTAEQLGQSKAALEKGIADLNGVFDLGLFSDPVRKNLEYKLNLVNQAVVRKTQDIREGVEKTLVASAPTIAAAMETAVGGIAPNISAAAADAKTAARAIPRNIAEGIRERRALVADALTTLRDALKNEMSPAKERAHLLGELASKELAKGLKSKDPVVKAAATQARNTIMARLNELVPANGKLGKKSAEELAKALKSKDPTVRAAAQRIKHTIEDKLREVKAKKIGAKKGQDAADGVRSKKGAVGRAALALANEIANKLVGGLKGRLGDSQGTKSGGKAERRAAGGPAIAGVPYLVNEETPRSELFVPSTSGYVLTRADAMAAAANAARDGGSTGVTVNLRTYGTPMYASTPVEVGRQVRRAIRTGTPTPPARRAVWRET